MHTEYKLGLSHDRCQSRSVRAPSQCLEERSQSFSVLLSLVSRERYVLLELSITGPSLITVSTDNAVSGVAFYMSLMGFRL